MTDTQTTDRKAGTDELGLSWDDGGNLIDPPVIPLYEQHIGEAAARADQRAVDQLTHEYHDARIQLAQDRARYERDQAQANTNQGTNQ